MKVCQWFIRNDVALGSGLFSAITLAFLTAQVLDPIRLLVSIVTVSLLVLAGMPWILPIVKRLELPGFAVEFDRKLESLEKQLVADDVSP